MTQSSSREYSERDLLTSLRRLASTAPDAPFVYLQGPPQSTSAPDSSISNFQPVSNADAQRIVDHLAVRWHSRLADEYGVDWNDQERPVTVTLLTLPTLHSFFHLFALWALGVTVQYVNHDLGEKTLTDLIYGARSDLVVHAGLDEAVLSWLRNISSSHRIPILELPADEHALCLAQRALDNALSSPDMQSILTVELYSRIPDPSIISHSSASTGEPKLIFYSMRYWCFDIARHATEVLAQDSQQSAPRPRLLISRPFYNTYVGFIVLHLVSARPLALMQPLNRVTPTAVETLEALQMVKAGEIATFVEHGRQMILHARDNRSQGWMEALRALDQFAIAGSGVDAHLSSLVEQNAIRALNIFGTSEVGGMLVGPGPPTAPLHVLFPNPSQRHHLFLPVGHDVQLWSLVSAWPRLEHVLSYRPRLKANQASPQALRAEPYPGPGTHHGEPAVNWSDLFRPEPSVKQDGKIPQGYIHVGRSDDFLRHSNAGTTSAFPIEADLLQQARQRLGSDRVVNVQIFGSNLPGTAAVFVLRPSNLNSAHSTHSDIDVTTGQVGTVLLESVQATAQALSLPAYSHPSSLKFIKVIQNNDDDQLTLLTTHKGNLRRRTNTRNFSGWLDSLPWYA